MNMKKAILSGLKALIAVALIVLLVRSGRLDFAQIAAAFRHPFWLLVVALIMIQQIVLCAIRWRALLEGVHVSETFRNLFSYAWIAQFFSNFMPGAIGSDIVRVVYVVRSFPQKKAVTAMSVIVDRLIGLYAIILLTGLCVLWVPPELGALPAIHTMRVGLWSFIGLSLVCIPMAFSDWAYTMASKVFPKGGRIFSFIDAIHAFRGAKRQCFFSLAVAFVGHVGLVVALYAATRALSPDEFVSFKSICVIGPIGMVTLSVPITPAGLGVGQVAFSQLFHWVGYKTPTLGANTVTLFQVMVLATNLLGVIPFLSHRRRPSLAEVANT
jgi:uncharacterized membrane protein YbhN (UPF0104 family)